MDFYATLYGFYSGDAQRYHEHDYDRTTLIKRLRERRAFSGSFDFYRVPLRDIMRCNIYFTYFNAFLYASIGRLF